MIAFVLASLLPSVLLAILAFRFASDSMQAEIEQSLQVEAATVSQDIDKMLFERVQNARTWGRLEVMQEIPLGDVDKRLSKFLNGVSSGYRDVYDELLCWNTSGHVIASSNAASLGSLIRSSDGSVAAVEDLSIRMGPLHMAIGHSPTFPIDVDVMSMFNAGIVGRLRLRFNWAQIYSLLDQAGQGGRLVMLVDPHGKIIAASAELRRQGLLMQTVPRDWMSPGTNGILERNSSFLQHRQLTIGFDRSHRFAPSAGFGWTTMVIQPSRLAFVPIRRMAFIFSGLLILTSSLAAGFSLLVAGRIAQPIIGLTRLTRDYRHDRRFTTAPRSTTSEVNELTNAFVETMQALEQSRADLVRASKFAVLGELSAAMAHEIRTPIGILRSSAQMLAREPGLSDEGRELTGFIGSETERLNGLVSTLLDGTKTRVPHLTPCDLRTLAHQAVGLLSAQARQKQVFISEYFESQHPTVLCDAEQMTQIFLNLIQNSLQILPLGGRISISIRDAVGQAVVEIADDGPGIADDAMNRVFEPFFTKREGGIGLGLSIVRQIVESHGGKITAGKSHLGGASFTLRLPQSLEEP